MPKKMVVSNFNAIDDNKSLTYDIKVFKIMENIEISKAPGIDKLPGSFLKDGAKILSKPISEICNLSIFRGIFPNAYKVAKLKPIFKKGKKVDPSNYRPISLLPLISKIIEKVVHDQTNEFLSATRYYTTISLDSELITQLICVYLS